MIDKLTRAEVRGGLSAVASMPAKTHTEKQVAEIIIPAVLHIIDTCDELEKQRDVFFADLKLARDMLYNAFEPDNQSSAWKRLNDTITKVEAA